VPKKLQLLAINHVKDIEDCSFVAQCDTNAKPVWLPVFKGANRIIVRVKKVDDGHIRKCNFRGKNEVSVPVAVINRSMQFGGDTQTTEPGKQEIRFRSERRSKWVKSIAEMDVGTEEESILVVNVGSKIVVRQMHGGFHSMKFLVMIVEAEAWNNVFQPARRNERRVGARLREAGEREQATEKESFHWRFGRE
jgi:hypothetical protein